jgi:hypothetical protein
MTKLQQRIAGLIVLTIVSAVSLLAGGIVLGGASADDGDSGKDGTTIGNTMQFAPAGAAFNVSVSSHVSKDGEQDCVIAFGAADVDLGAMPELNLTEAPHLTLTPADGSQPVDIKVFSSELDDRDGPRLTKIQATEAKPISEEESEKLKADGLLKEVDPADCTIINPELMPEGWTPGKPFTGGGGAGGAGIGTRTSNP